MEQNNIKKNKTILIGAEEAIKILGPVGRNFFYNNLLKRDDFPAFRIKGCNKYFINRELLQAWADKQCNEAR
jgi:hypothetical protein